jgi:hypothetical protein
VLTVTAEFSELPMAILDQETNDEKDQSICSHPRVRSRPGRLGRGSAAKSDPEPHPGSRGMLRHEGLLQEGHILLQEKESRLLQRRQVLLQG